jgi:hypothetical protein
MADAGICEFREGLVPLDMGLWKTRKLCWGVYVGMRNNNMAGVRRLSPAQCHELTTTVAGTWLSVCTVEGVTMRSCSVAQLVQWTRCGLDFRQSYSTAGRGKGLVCCTERPDSPPYCWCRSACRRAGVLKQPVLTLTAHLHVVPRLRISGAIPPLPLFIKACTRPLLANLTHFWASNYELWESA